MSDHTVGKVSVLLYLGSRHDYGVASLEQALGEPQKLRQTVISIPGRLDSFAQRPGILPHLSRSPPAPSH